MTQSIELSTTIGRLRDIDAAWLPHYDTVYLGDPFCRLLKGNLIEDRQGLRQAVADLHADGKEVFMTTYVEPWTDEMAPIFASVDHALDAGVDGIEVLNLGVLHMVSRNFSKARIRVNGFVPCFNPQTANAFAEFGVERVMAYHELTLEEIDAMREGSEVEIELLVQGHIPLGYAEFCMINPDHVKNATPCAGDCYKDWTLTHKDLAMRTSGRMTASGREMCMIEHLPSLLGKGYKTFRIDGRIESTEWRTVMGRAYRQAANLWLSDPTATPSAAEVMSSSPLGVCNGYYFGKAGSEYVA